MRPPARAGLLAWMALGLLSVGLLACFEQPFEERLRLFFPAAGGVRVELTVELHRTESVESSKAVRERLEKKEEELLEGWDAWKPRFAAMTAADESFAWRKREGKLRRLRRTALLTDAGELRRFFGDTPVYAEYLEEADGSGAVVAQLSLYPGPADQASRRERRLMAETLEAWSDALAVYLQAVDELYLYLDEHPERATACFATLFDVEEGAEELTAGENTLVEAVAEAMEQVSGVLQVDPQEARSLEEVSRRVYDPFPARLEIEVEGEVLEAVGFEPAAGEASGLWQVPGLSLWASFEQLEGTFLAPDPLLAYLRHELSGTEQPFDVRAFATHERRLREEGPPNAREVRQALDFWLLPLDTYRVTWRRG